MSTSMIRMLFLIGTLFVPTQGFTAGGPGQPQTIGNQAAASVQGFTLSGHAIPAVKALPDKRFAPDSILIRFRPAASANEKAVGRQMVKGKKIHGYSLVPGLEHLRIGIPGLAVEKAISILERLPIVEYAQPNYIISANQTIPNDSQFPEQWGLYNTGQASTITNEFGNGTVGADIGATSAWDIITSSSKPVAIIDTGIGYDHPDLVNNVWTNIAEFEGTPGIDDDGNGYVDDIHGWDFANNDNDPYDGNGHGSHVAGIVAAQGNDGASIPDFPGLGIDMGACGVLWQGQLMALKAIGDNGMGLLSDAILALQYAVNMGARVSNSSWGYYGEDEPDHWALYDAIVAAQSADHLFIAAAGNGDNNGSPGYDTDAMPHYPSSFELDNIISVAATDNNDNLGSFSNYGANSVDLAAPGVAIFNTFIYPYFLWWDYAWLSGTSMAAPHVAGVAAMLTELHPDWSYSQIRGQILTTVRKPKVNGGNPLEGKTVTGGVLNAASAVALTGNPPTADFSYHVNGLTVQYTDLSDDSDGAIEEWGWSFGDGNSSTEQSPVHTYGDYGSYSVTLTVTDNDGNSGSVSKVVTVAEPPNVLPVAQFQWSCTGLYCYFDGSASYDSDGQITSFYWDLGDGFYTDLQTFSHQYNDAAEYTVSLTVTDDDGATSSDTQLVTVTSSAACNNNGTCETGEDCNTCPADCISGDGVAECGNGICEVGAGEDCISCPEDCNGKQNGAAKLLFCCGDDGTNPVSCDDARCSEAGRLCDDRLPASYCCGDVGCTGIEDGFNCAVDCGLPEMMCSDGLDNDGDGYFDCDDPDCDGDTACAETCLVRGEPCSADSDCCSGACHDRKLTCK